MCIYQCDLVNVPFSDMQQGENLYKKFLRVLLTYFTMYGNTHANTRGSREITH